MATVAITNDALNYNEFKDLTFTAGTTDGFLFDFQPDSSRLLIVFQNTAGAAGTVTVKQGDSIQGVEDLEAYSIAASGISAIVLESGAFKNVTGALKGKVKVVPSATTIKACAIQLP
jgi:hypothetical protein